MKRATIVRLVFQLSAGALCLLYSALGIVGLGFFGGRLHKIADVYFVLYPLAAFPLFLVSFISLRWSVGLLWTYLIMDQIWQVRGNWRILFSLSTFTGSSSADRWLALAAALMTVALIVERRSHNALNTA